MSFVIVGVFMSVDSNFSDLYRADPTQAQKLLDHPDAEIIQKIVQTPSLFGTRTTVTRHLCLSGQDYGPIDELSGILCFSFPSI